MFKDENGFSLNQSQAAIDDFLNPPTVDIGEVLRSTKKRRLTVGGTVCMVRLSFSLR